MADIGVADIVKCRFYFLDTVAVWFRGTVVKVHNLNDKQFLYDVRLDDQDIFGGEYVTVADDNIALSTS